MRSKVQNCVLRNTGIQMLEVINEYERFPGTIFTYFNCETILKLDNLTKLKFAFSGENEN